MSLKFKVTTREETLQAQWGHSIEEPHSFGMFVLKTTLLGNSKGTEQSNVE